MGKCYKSLGIENKAKVSFNLAEKLLHNDKEKLESLLEDKQRTYVKERDWKETNDHSGKHR